VDIAGFVVAVVAVIVSAMAVWYAHGANRIAQEALDTQKLTAPPVWTELVRSRGRRTTENRSGRDVIVYGFEVVGDESSVRVPQLPQRVEYGDSFEFRYEPTFDASADRVVIVWGYEKDDGLQRTERRL
jgi:hypothetical protein